MKIANKYFLKQKITATQSDMKSLFRFDSILGAFQDATTAHSAIMGVDHDGLIASSNAFWVLSKIKFKISGSIKTGDEVTIQTWPKKPSAFRFIREYLIEKDGAFAGEDASVKIEGKSEWCVLDADTHMLRKLSSICYPKFEHIEDSTGVSDFARLKIEVGEEDLAYTYKTALTDIDCNAHVNNLAYARMSLNAFSPEEFALKGFNAFELHFISQTFYGDEISIYKKTTESGVYVEGKKADLSVFKALFYNE